MRRFFQPVFPMVLQAVLLAAVLAVAFPAFAADAGNVLESLQRKNAGISSFSCDFTQETRIPLFDAPVLSEGRMAFMRPDGLRWEYTAPMREGFAVMGGKGLRWRDGVIAREGEGAAKDPFLAMIAGELMVWVTLDMARIEKNYALSVTASDPPTLSLTPKLRETASVVEALTIVFDSSGLAQSVTIAEKQGGVTIIRFSNAKTNQPVNVMELP